MAREDSNHTYGKGISRHRAYWQRVLKQAVALKLIDIEFNIFTFNNAPRVCRRYQLHHEVEGNYSLPDEVNVPDRDNAAERRDNDLGNVHSSKPTERKGRGRHYLPVIKDLLLTKESWDDIVSKEDYMLPGFSSLPKVSYCNDWKTIPLASSNDSFMEKDCQLSLGPTNSTKHELSIMGVLTKVSIRRGHCEGVKFCRGEGCDKKYVVSRSQKVNRCPEHSKTKIPLEESGPCPVNIAYVKPEASSDRRRWIVTLSLDRSGHNHSMPSPHTIPTAVKEDMRAAVAVDPSRTAFDLQKGKHELLSIITITTMILFLTLYFPIFSPKSKFGIGIYSE